MATVLLMFSTPKDMTWAACFIYLAARSQEERWCRLRAGNNVARIQPSWIAEHADARTHRHAGEDGM